MSFTCAAIGLILYGMMRRIVNGPITPRAWLLFALMCTIFGTTFLAIKIGSNSGAPPFLAAGLRFTTAGSLLLLTQAGRIRRSHLVTMAMLWRTAVLGLLMIAVAFAATYFAADYIGSGQLAQIQAVSPVVVGALSVLILGKRLSRSHLWGLLFGFSGALLLVGSTGSLGPGYLLGAVVALFAEGSYALGSIWYRWAFDDPPDPTVTNGLSMFFGGTFLLALAVVSGQTAFPLTAPALGSLAYLVLIGALVGHTIHLWLIANVSPLFASTFLFVSPVIATLLGAVVLGESITIANVLGAGGVLVGVFAIQRGEAAERLDTTAEGDTIRVRSGSWE